MEHLNLRWKKCYQKGIDVILEIIIQGALKVKENFEEGVFHLLFFPPSMEELKTKNILKGSELQSH